MEAETRANPIPGDDATEKWRSGTRKEWSDKTKVDAWRKWGRENFAATSSATEALIDAAMLSPGQQVLDVAGGGGVPGIVIAEKIGPDGHLTITDISPGMLESARLVAESHRLTNIVYRESDAEDMPFADESFDRAVCRFGVMFFADEERALREIRRVLKPGGRAAFVAWGPLEQNHVFASVMGPVREHGNPPPPPEPGAPFMFRYGESGSLSNALKRSGFQDVSEELVESSFEVEGSPETILEMMLDMGGLHGMLSDLTEKTRTALLSDALANYSSFAEGNMVKPPIAFVVATGIR